MKSTTCKILGLLVAFAGIAIFDMPSLSAWQDLAEPVAQNQAQPGTTRPVPGMSGAQPTPPLRESEEDLLAAGRTASGLTDVARLPSTRALTLLGDQPPSLIIIRQRPGSKPREPQQDKIASSTARVASVRGFKISENESPIPQDRVYITFNYFDRLNQAVFDRLDSGISNLDLHRETFGIEKTLLDGDASVGLRVPLLTLNADSEFEELRGNSTDLGDLTVIAKYAFWRDRETGNILSGGLAVTPPSGPDRLGGHESFPIFHHTLLQPFIGYRWNIGNCFVHGFTAVDVPTNSEDATLLFNDVGLGYWLYRSADETRLLQAVVPTFEVHITNPLNHRGVFSDDLKSVADTVNLTFGTTLSLGERSTLALGFVTPVTGPKPFDWEFLTYFSWHFGPR